MWKCIGLTLLLGQFIVVTSQGNEDEVQRHTRKAEECCPCPGQGRDVEPSASDYVPSVDCPCKARSGDLEPASSLFSPVRSAVKPFARSFDQKADPKPLLEPEVGLASSVLETLREVTEEEYQDAVARDAARSAIQTVLPDEAATNLVTVVVSPDARESVDDVLPEASNPHESRCVLPEYESYPDKTPFNTLHDDLFQRNDMTDAPSNIDGNIQVPDRLRASNTPLRNLYKKTIWPSHIPYDNRAFYIPTHRENNLLRRPLLSSLDARSLFGPIKPLDIPNLLNLRDVELIPAKKVSIARGHHMRPESGVNRILSPTHNMHSDSNFQPTQHFDSPVQNLGTGKDCNGDGTEINHNYDNVDKNIHTDIISTIPTATKPLYYNGNNFDQPHNVHHSNKPINPHENFAATGQTPNNCVEENSHFQNTLYNPRGKQSEINKIGFHRSNLNQLSTEASNNLQAFQRTPDNMEHRNDLSRDASEISNTYLNSNAPGVNNLRSVTDDVRQNNVISDDSWRSSESDPIQRKTISELCSTLGNAMNPSNFLEQGRSNDENPKSITMNNLQTMSDSMLRSFNEDVLKKINLPKNDYGRTSTDDMGTNGDTLKYDNPIPRTSMDHDKASTSAASCFEFDKSARNTNNEMNTAASEFINPLYRMQQGPNALEDINLDIFQYQPPLPRSNGIRNPELPFINMKSYKTQLPIPKALDFQPVKLQKAIRRGNDILGATLSMKPHAQKNSLPIRKDKLRSTLNQANGLIIPDIDDVRAYIENNVQHIYDLPFLSNLACNHLSPLSQQLHTKTYLPGNLDNSLRDGDGIDNNLMDDAIFNPSDVIESIAEAREDINDKLKTLRLNLDERIKQFHESITGQSRTPTLLSPQQNRATTTRYNPISDRGNIFNRPASTSSGVRESRLPGLRPTLNNEAPNRRPTVIRDNPSVLSNARSNRPLTTPDLTSKKVESTGLRPSQTDTRKTPSLLDRLKSRESKGIISLTTTKRPPIIPAKPKPVLPRPSTLQSKLAQPRPGVERLGIKRKETTREPQTSPSEVSYTKTPSSIPESLGRESSGPSPNLRSLNKSIKPKIAENDFLSKVKEAVFLKDARTAGSNSDVLPSASETVRHTDCSSGMSFNCKMVCEHS